MGFLVRSSNYTAELLHNNATKDTWHKGYIWLLKNKNGMLNERQSYCSPINTVSKKKCTLYVHETVKIKTSESEWRYIPGGLLELWYWRKNKPLYTRNKCVLKICLKDKYNILDNHYSMILWKTSSTLTLISRLLKLPSKNDQYYYIVNDKILSLGWL